MNFFNSSFVIIIERGIFKMNDKEKCNNYEAYFVFSSNKDFENHLENCEDCRQEHEKYRKVSQLVKEVAPIYLKRKQQQKISVVKKLACCFVLFVGLTAFTGYKAYDNYVMNQEVNEDSCISTLGLPIDDYGFLEI